MELDAKGFVLTDSDLGDVGFEPLPFETSRAGILPAGDVRSQSMKRVAAAVGDAHPAVGMPDLVNGAQVDEQKVDGGSLDQGMNPDYFPPGMADPLGPAAGHRIPVIPVTVSCFCRTAIRLSKGAVRGSRDTLGGGIFAGESRLESPIGRITRSFKMCAFGPDFLGTVVSRLPALTTVSPAVAVSIALAFLAAVTLLPAMLILAGRRGWVTPRGTGNNRFWRVVQVRIVMRPRTSP